MIDKTANKDAVLKVRIPKTLMERVNDYRHDKKLESRTDAVISLLTHALDTPESPSLKPTTGI